MLIIERRPGAAVQIGNNIRVVVRSVKGGRRVKLGIEAPCWVPVLRDELVASDGEKVSSEVLADFCVLVAEPSRADRARVSDFG